MAFSNLLYLPPLGPDGPSLPSSLSLGFHTYVHAYIHIYVYTRSYKLLPRYYTCPFAPAPTELLLNLIHPRMGTRGWISSSWTRGGPSFPKKWKGGRSSNLFAADE